MTRGPTILPALNPNCSKEMACTRLSWPTTWNMRALRLVLSKARQAPRMAAAMKRK